MAKKKKEEPIVDNDTGSLKVKEKVEKQPDSKETKSDVTEVKEKMVKPAEVYEETITKVNIDEPKKETEEIEEVSEKVSEEVVETEISLQDISNEEKAEEIASVASKAIKESMQENIDLPENIQKLVDFMEETGGDLNDYVSLNKDYSEMDNQDILQEYYKQTKPHLNNEEINFLMEDQFSFDEEEDEDKDIKRKKLALKEQVANAKSHLDGQKSKYYEDIKAGSKLTNDQQEALEFYDKYSKEAEQTKQYEEKAKSTFLNKTNRFFGDQFKGFDYEIGEKKFRLNVSDVNKVKENQSDINNFIGKFLDKDRQMSDEAGYHRALFTAMNPDTIANHFYEQGKSDALKESVSNSKNINMDPRQELNNSFSSSGTKVKVLGDTTADFKFKIKNKNK